MHGWDGAWHMGGMWLWWALGLALVVGVAWLLLRAVGGREDEESSRESPEQILKRRYASGEIEREEYERRLEDMRA